MPSSRAWEWGDPMLLDRREWLAGCAGALASLSPLSAAVAAGLDESTPLGVVGESFSIRRAATRARPESERFDDPLVFLDHGHSLGARGIQVGIGARDEAYTRRLRER